MHIKALFVLLGVVLLSLASADEQQVYRSLLKRKSEQFVTAHNEKNDTGFTLKAYDKFAHLTLQEFSEIYLMKTLPASFQAKLSQVSRPQIQVKTPPLKLRESPSGRLVIYNNIDWVKENKTSSVKDQGACGSCWAFAAVSDIETTYLFKRKSYDLSEQQLVDCSFRYGNSGCNGGWMGNAFMYVIAKGITTEAQYPYSSQSYENGTETECRKARSKISIRSFSTVSYTAYDCNALARILSRRPVTTAVCASSPFFYLYESGVMSATCTELDHAINVVGLYSDNTGLNYWKIKNSWGTSWGQNGYMNIDRGINGGNTALICSYPLYTSL